MSVSWGFSYVTCERVGDLGDQCMYWSTGVLAIYWSARVVKRGSDVMVC